MDQEAKLDYLIDYVWHENPDFYEKNMQKNVNTFEEKVALFRGLCNVRQPKQVSKEFIDVQNSFLTSWNKERDLTSLDELQAIEAQLYLWQGDITSLKVDAIVNAANSKLLGCMQANHHCIDNIIHTRAGVQLRLACHELIEEQARKEASGKAKITKAYNLPSTYVIHTVGPFIDERGVTPLKEHLLASSYTACLRLADAHELDTIAFCCISTGEFNYPNEEAAKVAVQTVKKYIKNTGSNIEVIFNVFKDKDLHIYESLLTKKA